MKYSQRFGSLHISRRLMVAGMGSLLGGVASLHAMPVLARSRYQIKPDIVVAKDGSGDFTSVHAALQSIPRGNRERKIVLVRNGTYDEHVRVDAAYVTLRGESRTTTRIRAHRPASLPIDDIGRAVLNIAPTAHDFVVENLTVHNTVEEPGPHAFAILGYADRVVIQNADVLSRGADTMAMWRLGKRDEETGLSNGAGATPLLDDGGRYFHKNLRITGSVDFICPRGWCYMDSCEVEQVYPLAEAAFWHDGRNNSQKKFVIRNSRVDGPDQFYLARAHRDAHFYFLDCTFSQRLRDQAPYLVRYPLPGRQPSAEDSAANAKIAEETRAGVRSYFSRTHRTGGDYQWMADNLRGAPGSPINEIITAKWAFDGSWDPEAIEGPKVTAMHFRGGKYYLEFDCLVTVKGAPELDLVSNGRAPYVGGSGTNVLEFVIPPQAGSPEPRRLLFERGDVIASEGSATIRRADTTLLQKRITRA